MTRRVLTLLITGLLALGLTTVPAHAGAVEKIDGTSYDVSCVFETREGPLVFFFASQGVSGKSGSGMFVETADGEMVLTWDKRGTASFDPTFSASVDLVHPQSGAPAGTATVAATLTPGESQTFEVRDRPGNTWQEKGTRTDTEYAVSDVEAQVPGLTVIVRKNDCSATSTEFHVKTTNPSAELLRDTDFGTDICDVEGFGNAQIRISRDTFEMVIEKGDDIQLADGELRWQGPKAHGIVPLRDLFTDKIIARLDVTVSLERAGRLERRSESGKGWSERVHVVPYVAHVDLESTDGRSGTASCLATSVRTRIFFSPN
ncbi:MAG TPA: hypothetical protein VFX15_15435 [Actinomycetes bacterium]|nr:hypothetical protein [Actinomycetes bacterium]